MSIDGLFFLSVPGVTSVYTYSATDHYGAQPEGVALHVIKDGRMRLL